MLTGIANHLWQSTLFAAAAWLLTLALRRNRAAVRYQLWLAASLKFLVPFSLFVSLGSHIPPTRGAPGSRTHLSPRLNLSVLQHLFNRRRHHGITRNVRMHSIWAVLLLQPVPLVPHDGVWQSTYTTRRFAA